MKIVQINSVFGYGSTGKIVNDIHQLAEQAGNQSMVFYGRGKNATKKNIVKVSNTFSNLIDVLLTRLLNRHAEANIFNTLVLIRRLKQFKPDVIHLHNIHGYYVNYKILFKYLKKSEIPVIWLLHDQWSISGNAAYFDSNNINWETPHSKDVKKLSGDYPKYQYFGIQSAKRNYFAKKKSFTLDNLTLVTPSRWLKVVCQNSFFHNNQVHVIYNGINLEIFKPKFVDINQEKKVILGVSNEWDRRKGLEYFIKLANDLDNQYQIILVGINDDIAKTLPKNINHIKRTESVTELTELYCLADVLVNPTMEDNFPTVNLEAQACGTPVITFDTGGSGESITELTGKVIERGNYKKLYKEVSNWPKKNTRIINECVKNAKKYDKINMQSDYMELYSSLIGEKNGN